MNVGDLNYAQAVNAARESIQPDPLMVYDEPVAGTPAIGDASTFGACPNIVRFRRGANGRPIETIDRRRPALSGTGKVRLFPIIPQ
jgi:hypothetical protein